MHVGRKMMVLAGVLVLAGTLAASGQFGTGMRQPRMQGLWNPIVGSGGAYEIESKNDRGERKTQMEIAVVGSETVDGKPGYWVEMAFAEPRGGGQAYIKHLIVLDGKQTSIKRRIMQPPGQGPMEFPATMIQRSQPTEQPADIRDRAERVGTESVTTPAGTFTCEHYRMKDGSADAWISEKVAPWGVVKTTGPESNMTLARLITNAKTHITGTPVKFDPMEMMRQRNKQ